MRLSGKKANKHEPKTNHDIMVNNKRLKTSLRLLCNFWDITEEELKQRGSNGRLVKLRTIVQYRQIYYYLSAKYLNPRASYAEIGSIFGQDHATVIHAKNTIADLMEIDKQIALMVNEADDFYRKNVISKLELLDPRSIPTTTYQRIKHEKNNAEAKVNKMYYTCLSFLQEFNLQINQDKVIEGFRREKLDKKYWQATQKLKYIKME